MLKKVMLGILVVVVLLGCARAVESAATAKREITKTAKKVVKIMPGKMCPYSGVDLNTLTDTPMLMERIIFEATGEQLLKLGTGMELGEVEGEQVVLTKEGFMLEFDVKLPATAVRLSVEASAPTKGSDSYWVELDGKRLKSIAGKSNSRHCSSILALSYYKMGLEPGDIDKLATGSGIAGLSYYEMGTTWIAVKVEKPGRHTFKLQLHEGPGSFIRHLSVSEMEVKIPRPPMRKELLGKHPRLFFTADDIPALRERIKDPRVQQFYKRPPILTKKPLPHTPAGRRTAGTYRTLGDYALEYLLKPNEKQLAALIEWLEMAATFGDLSSHDLDVEYFMEGLALTYDWLYNYIPEDLRIRVRDAIAKQCRNVFEASLAGCMGGGINFQANHYWYPYLSLALGASAICSEVPDAEQWLSYAWDRFERIVLTLGTGGDFHEGVGYWDFSMPTLYMYTDLYEWCTGLHIPAGDDGLKGQAEFRFHSLYPGLTETAALEDTRIGAGKPPIRLLLWEAKRFQDPVTMGIAKLLLLTVKDALGKLPVEQYVWDVERTRRASENRFNLLWLDEDLAAEDPLEKLPLAKHFWDIETALARTSWDDDATFVAFVSRPIGGHKYAEICAKFGIGGTGHNQPAQNHFVLFSRGVVLAGDPGYQAPKYTRNHNTILVDGKGQYGDGERWLRPNPGRAHITHFVTKGDVTIISGDAASAYPEELGLKRFDRTLVLAGRNLVVIYDRLAARQPSTFSWLLHHYGEIAEDTGKWTIKRGNAQMTVVPLLPGEIRTEHIRYRPPYGNRIEPEVNMLELKTVPLQEAIFLVPLLISDAGKTPPDVKYLAAEGCDAIQIGETVVAFNRTDGEISVPLPWGETLETTDKVIVARLHESKQQIITAKNTPPVRKTQ